MSPKEYLEQNYTLVPGPRGVIEIANVGRDDLAAFLARFCTVGAEIGVAHGKYSKILMDANPTLKLYGVDPYQAYQGYRDYALQRTLEALRADAHVRLDKYSTYEFVRKFSVDAAQDFADESLDFVYIDANHSDPFVTQDITVWDKKVKRGGIMCGHDYARIKGSEHDDSSRWAVIQALHRYAEEHGIQIYIWGLNAKDGQKRDDSRSWMYFKD